MNRLLKAAQARKLDRVAAAYAVAGWLLVQGAAIALPGFGAPEWALRVFIAVILVGFPLTLGIAWVMAPHPRPGKRGARVQTTQTDKTLLALLGAVILLSVVQFGYQFWRQPAATQSTAASGTAAPAEASIAVLAFNNMSNDPKNEYFSDGISEELLNDLARVPGLRVAARTSSFSFKGKNAKIEDIGKALNVRTVLEGSVRHQETRVRISAQLINAADGYHLWSQTYDRDIADIFAVQDEIANAITRELTGHLIGSKASDKAIPAKPKINPDAYTAYLQGRFFMNKRNKDNMLRAVDFFKQAIALEPNFADAHSSLGRTYVLLYLNGQRRDTLQAAKDEIATALQLDPDNFQALVTKGLIAYSSQNWREADTTLRRATELNPNDADARHFYASFLDTLNLVEAAITPGRRAATLDPLAPIMRSSLGDYLHRLNRNAEAATEYQAALTLDPNFVFALGGLCRVNADLGKLAEAKKILRDRLIPVNGEDGPATDLCRVDIASRSGDLPELKRLTTIAPRLYESGNLVASDVAWVFGVAGDVDQAIHWFEKANDERDIWLFYYIRNPDLPAKLKADPRWTAFMQRPLIKEWQAAHDHIAAELAKGE